MTLALGGVAKRFVYPFRSRQLTSAGETSIFLRALFSWKLLSQTGVVLSVPGLRKNHHHQGSRLFPPYLLEVELHRYAPSAETPSGDPCYLSPRSRQQLSSTAGAAGPPPRRELRRPQTRWLDRGRKNEGVVGSSPACGRFPPPPRSTRLKGAEKGKE